jgi:hypothetical protein
MSKPSVPTGHDLTNHDEMGTTGFTKLPNFEVFLGERVVICKCRWVMVITTPKFGAHTLHQLLARQRCYVSSHVSNWMGYVSRANATDFDKDGKNPVVCAPAAGG